jgi:F-box/TPR repeat protein Pof3
MQLLKKSHKDLLDKLSPPKSVDPLTVLPRELAEMVLEYLTFRQRINACLVTKQWAQFIRSSPNLWTHLDLIGARKKVPNRFISRAINVARTKLTAARLNNLYDFEKTIRALVKACPLEELTFMKCGLQGQHLTDALANAKHLKSFSLGRDSELQPYQLQHLLTAVSERIESFHCNISRGGVATIDGATCKNLKMLSLSFPNPAGLTSLLANVSTCLPNLQHLTLRQTETNSSFRTGMHMDLDKCGHLQSVDLSLAFSSTSLLTLPQSLRIVKLNPILNSNPEHFFRPISMDLQPHYSLPNMQELTIDLPRLAIHRASYMLEGNKDVVRTESGSRVCHCTNKNFRK